MTTPDFHSGPPGLFAYGPVPGVELIPYFLALLAWIGLALGALLLSPFKAAIRLFRKSRAAPSTGSEVVPGPGPEPAIQPPSLAPPVPELPIEDPRSSV